MLCLLRLLLAVTIKAAFLEHLFCIHYCDHEIDLIANNYTQKHQYNDLIIIKGGKSKAKNTYYIFAFINT